MRLRVLLSLRSSVVVLALVGAFVATAATTSAATATRSQGQGIIKTPNTRPLRTAMFDPFVFGGWQQAKGFSLLRAAGATYVRILVHWYKVAPLSLPTGFVASDPSSPGYDWSSLDSTVAAAEKAGLSPIFDIGSTPSWAWQIPPVGRSGGTPKVDALGEFATALATRYDGKHGPPAVRAYEVWNEPNLSLDLNPVNPNAYRNMVNAVATSVHAVNASNLVVAGGLDPFGGSAKRYRTMSPLTFMRGLLCLSKGAKPRKTCNTPVQFDVWSHHPYTFQGPFGHAKQPNDVSLGDLPEMRALLQAGVRLGQVVSSKPVQFWVTEFSWDTNPPRRAAAPPKLEARWTAEAFRQMWLSGVSLVTWFLLQDQPGISPWQSGLYFSHPSLVGAKAKPMRTSYRFPFVAYLGKKNTVSIWGRDATSSSTTVQIQQQHNSRGKWKTVARIRANRYGIFLAKSVKLKQVTAKDSMRATAPGSGNSLSFSLTRPSPKIRFGPWGNP